MKLRLLLVVCLVVMGVLITSCDVLLSASDGQDLESTRVALAIQQTSMAMDQTRQAQVQPVNEQPALPEPTLPLQPTYTLYPTYTIEPTQEPPPMEEPTTPVLEPTAETEPELSYEDWLKEAKILLYDDMYGYWDPQPVVIANAIDGLGLGRNTTNVKDAMGNLLSNMVSATNWDLIIIAAERRDAVSGEYFDALATSLDRGSSVILEVWYLDQVHFGRIQPVMQRCGIAFHRDWPRNWNSDPNSYLVYLLEPTHPMFSEPNIMGMLIPYDILWWSGDAGDLTKINPGSSAGVLLAGSQQKEFNSYGLIANCMDGRMIWQTFSTHDYRTEEMINLWQNYIMYTLKARYAYLQE